MALRSKSEDKRNEETKKTTNRTVEKGVGIAALIFAAVSTFAAIGTDKTRAHTGNNIDRAGRG